MNRRQFIQTTALAATATAGSFSSAFAAPPPTKGVNWPIGCFNRPWVNEAAGWTMDTALDGIKAAGYEYAGLLTGFKGQPFIGADATAEYLAELKGKIAARSLKAIMGALRVKAGVPVAESIKNIRTQIDNAKTLGLEHLLTFGVDREADYEDYFQVMADAAAYAQERGLKVVLKPHGGGSGAAAEILHCIEKIKQPNFQVWYDAGNIIYYTGKDPLEQLKPIVQHVTGFCAKDCAGPKGEIWLDFGKGKVDFPAVFGLLKSAGFNGPVMVECCAKGPTPEETTAGAKRNREQLEKYFKELA